ncbi:type I-E CRISPR-associated protein Cse2/CasB [Streptomyces sp. 7N604]|uniref:type I-E CRISPR-associated protein Cse2/CasB n=1 Tax=Streptomyces sp. 7N604 TaxID=3457415 RepID=UPI003FD506C5
MTSTSPARYWHRYITAEGTWRRERAPGEDLAALRAGLGREAMDVPKMWPYYTCTVDDGLARRGGVSTEQRAEHAALALFGLHQQSQQDPMHRPGIGLGQALRRLRTHGKFSEQAIDARVGALASANSAPMLLHRLRGLIPQLRTIRQPLDYDRLLRDIRAWHYPDTRQRVRRTWALDYQVWAQPTAKAPETTGL